MPWGLPGFEAATRFMLVENPDFAPLVFLQSLDTAELCFAAAPVAAIAPEYELAMTREDLERLELDPSRQPGPEEIVSLALLCAPENGPPTANLLAPIVIHLATHTALQAVRADRKYSHQYSLTPDSAAPAEEVACL